MFLVLVIWLVPIKSYKLPITLPFQLELYRLVIVVLLFAWLLAALFGRAHLSAGTLGLPLILFALAIVASMLTNRSTVEATGYQTQSIKTLTYLLSFLVAFVLVSSTVRTRRDIEAIITALVAGAVIVAVGALVQGRNGYNAFEHLQSWFPLLRRTRAGINDLNPTSSIRFSRLRVYASSQHPIALGAALIMMAPLALYLARRAASPLASRLWLLSSFVIAAGAFASQSRTVVVMLVVMVLFGLWLRPKAVARRWPLLPVLLVAIHLLAPRTLGTIYHAFHPKNGLVAEQQSRPGQAGAGRLAVLSPGLKLWQTEPIFGRGPKVQAVKDYTALQAGPQGDAIIFNNQYLGTLVVYGIVGFLGLFWFVWASFLKVGLLARRTTGLRGDLLAACSVSCAGFAIGLFTFDSLAFVQVMLIFFVVAALGLRARALVLESSLRPGSEPCPADIPRTGSWSRGSWR